MNQHSATTPGRKVQITHGLQDTLDEIDAVPDEMRRDFQGNYSAMGAAGMKGFPSKAS